MNRNQGSLLTSIYTIIALGITMIFFFPLWWSFSNSLRIPKETFTVTGVGVPFIHFTPTLGNWQHQLSFPEAQVALTNSSVSSSSVRFGATANELDPNGALSLQIVLGNSG